MLGSGKTALVLSLCKHLRDKVNMGVVTNDIFTREDCEFLIRNEALEEHRISCLETGGCPHAAIREVCVCMLCAFVIFLWKMCLHI